MHQIRRWDRDHTCRAAHGLDERQRHARLGKRLRLLGRLEPARPLDPAVHAADPEAIRPPVRRRGLDAAGADGEALVYASLWQGDGLRLWTLVNRSDRHGRRHAAQSPSHRRRQLFRSDRRSRGDSQGRRRDAARRTDWASRHRRIHRGNARCPGSGLRWLSGESGGHSPVRRLEHGRSECAGEPPAGRAGRDDTKPTRSLMAWSPFRPRLFACRRSTAIASAGSIRSPARSPQPSPVATCTRSSNSSGRSSWRLTPST